MAENQSATPFHSHRVARPSGGDDVWFSRVAGFDLQQIGFARASWEIASDVADVVYFPAYEIVSGPQAPHWFYIEGRREPSPQGIATVMQAFLSSCETVGEAMSTAGASASSTATPGTSEQGSVSEQRCECRVSWPRPSAKRRLPR